MPKLRISRLLEVRKNFRENNIRLAGNQKAKTISKDIAVVLKIK
jgi:hypothetical protein